MADEPPKSGEPIPLEYETPKPRSGVAGPMIGGAALSFGLAGYSMIMAGMTIGESMDKGDRLGGWLLAGMAVVCGGFVAVAIRGLRRNRRQPLEKRMAPFDAGFLAGVGGACAISGIAFLAAALATFQV